MTNMTAKTIDQNAAINRAEKYFAQIRNMANDLAEKATRREAEMKAADPKIDLPDEILTRFMNDIENMMRNVDYKVAAELAVSLRQAFDE